MTSQTSKRGRIVGYYVGTPHGPVNFRKLCDAQHRYVNDPKTTVLGRWREVVREGGWRSRSGEVMEDRRRGRHGE